MPAQDVVELTMILPRAAVVQMDQKVNVQKWYARKVRAKATAALPSPSANLLPADGMDFFFDHRTMCTSTFFGVYTQPSYGAHLDCRAPAPACTNIVPSLPEGEISPPLAPP